MHKIFFCGSQVQISPPKKGDLLRNFHRTFVLLLENYLPDPTNHYRNGPTAIGGSLLGVVDMLICQASAKFEFVWLDVILEYISVS